jgi:Zn finger protein HypA/HybF involved in hydrogenase expression
VSTDDYLHKITPEPVDIICQACDHQFTVEGYCEYGAWYPKNEDDLICPVCGGDEREEVQN